MTFVRIEIKDFGEHWHRRVWVLGMLVYHRHDYTKGKRERTAGFNTMPFSPVEIEDEDYYEEE